MSWQIEMACDFQTEWSLREVLPNASAVEMLPMDLKIWVMSSVGDIDNEFADIANLIKDSGLAGLTKKC